ncbi:YSC84-related protein [Corallincola platygyrae]|uniref:YSC84-related protein n=1 Tax=Corallincola platygyrae TaxID=1193278 RepID=A0ABW4XPD0_9GAMM
MKKVLSMLIAVFLVGCSAKGSTPAEQRAEVQKMNQEVISAVYKQEPAAKKLMSTAAGYATFSNAQVNIIFVAGGGGYGMAKDNSTGKITYMEMGEGGVGLGLGAKDYRVLFVFHTKAALNSFIEDGWVFGGEADAAAKTKDKGGEASGGAKFGDVTVYQLTEAGLAIQATAKGAKYWKSDELN